MVDRAKAPSVQQIAKHYSELLKPLGNATDLWVRPVLMGPQGKWVHELLASTMLREMGLLKPKSPSQHNGAWKTGNFLQTVEEDASRAGYTTRLLFCRKTCAPSYELLVDVIGALGDPGRYLGTPTADPNSGSLRPEAERARRVLAAFCQRLGADCWTAYAYDRVDNRPVLYDMSGLQWPEAMYSHRLLHSVVARHMFGADSTEVILAALVDSSLSAPSFVSFARREGVDPRQVIAIRLLWRDSRVLIFLNRRKGGDESTLEDTVRSIGTKRAGAASTTDQPLPDDFHHPPALANLWAALADLPDHRDTGYAKARERVEAERRTLDLTVRQLQGFLNGVGGDLSVVRADRRPELPLDPIMKSLISAYRDGNGLAHLEGGLKVALNSKDSVKGHQEYARLIYARVLEVQDGKVHFPKNDEYLYVLPSGECEQALSASVRTDDAGLVETSICAQAAAWGVSLLVGKGDALERKRVRRISRDRVGVGMDPAQVPALCAPVGAEVAIPIRGQSAREVVAVANLECETTLDADQLKRAEAVVRAYEALREYNSRGSTGFVAECLNQAAETDREKAMELRPLLKGFCDWLVRTVPCDMARIVSYDRRTRSWRPVAVAVSRELAKQALANCDVLNMGVQAAGALAAELASPEPTEAATIRATALDDGVREIVAEAIAPAFYPRSRGITWDTFTGRRTHFFCHEAHRSKDVLGDEYEEKTQAEQKNNDGSGTCARDGSNAEESDGPTRGGRVSYQTLIERYSQWLYCAPFTANEHAFPEGVLSLACMTDNGKRPNEVEQIIGADLRVLAAIYALNRYFSP